MKVDLTYFCPEVGAEVTDRECVIRHTFDWRRGFGVCRRCRRGAVLCPNLHPGGFEQPTRLEPWERGQKRSRPKKKQKSVFKPARPASGTKEKWCPRCRMMKTEADFRFSEKTKALMAMCKSCEGRGLTILQKRRRAVELGQRFCRMCCKAKPVDAFRFSERTNDFVATCKACEWRYGLGPWRKKKRGKP
ncbi:MAG: hypothetical protein SVS15_06165 [Thermodesulfobacteriota bacterium]|nr:hypothetical protein [Thermodesulfobacteriota bacterium]